MTRIVGTNQGTEQQWALENGAGELLVLLEQYVPGNVAHYAVEDLRRTLKQYLRLSTPSVTTRDAQADWNAMQTQVTQSPEQRANAELAEMNAAEERVLALAAEHGVVYANHNNSPLTLAIVRLAARGTLVKREGTQRGYTLPTPA